MALLPTSTSQTRPQWHTVVPPCLRSTALNHELSNWATIHQVIKAETHVVEDSLKTSLHWLSKHVFSNTILYVSLQFIHEGLSSLPYPQEKKIKEAKRIALQVKWIFFAKVNFQVEFVTSRHGLSSSALTFWCNKIPSWVWLQC